MTGNSSSQFDQDQLIATAQSGDLGQFVADAFRALEDDDWNVFVNDAAAAHADGQFDPMAALQRLSKLDYIVREFLQELLPRLALTLPELLALFERLDELSSGKEMAWWRAQVFENWCQADADRPEIAIEAIERDDAPGELLQPVLFAALKVDQRRYLPALLSLLNGQDEGFRTMAAWTLGRSIHLTGKQLDLAVAELKQSFVNVDGSIHAGSLGALISIGVREGRFESVSVAAAQRAAKSRSDPAVRSAAARELLGKLGAVGKRLVGAVFKLLADTKNDEADAITSIDLIIHNGLKSRHAQSVAKLLDHLISKQEIPLKQFDSTCHAILTGDRKQLDKVMLRWLADSSGPMIKAVHDLIATSHGDQLKFDLNFSSASLSDEQAIVLARKLSESLLIYPVTLASLLLSLISGPKGAIPDLMRLMYDPLLVNYWMSPREYLEEAAATAKPDVAAIIAQLLQAHRSYSDAIEAADTIPEMWPSDRHRYLVALKDSEERRAVSRAAESQSIFMSLVSKSVVLYGDAAIVGVHVEPGKVVRQESRMQTLEHWQELPRVELIDPVGQWYRRATLASGKDI